MWIFEISQKIKWDLQGRCMNCGAKSWSNIEDDQRPGEHYKHLTCAECGHITTWDLLPEFR